MFDRSCTQSVLVGTRQIGADSLTMADFWEEEREDELVTMWQELPCLFDVTAKTHSNRNAVVKAPKLSHPATAASSQPKQHKN